jgi:anti-anti-sigma regulatory factor
VEIAAPTSKWPLPREGYFVEATTAGLKCLVGGVIGSRNFLIQEKTMPFQDLSDEHNIHITIRRKCFERAFCLDLKEVIRSNWATRVRPMVFDVLVVDRIDPAGVQVLLYCAQFQRRNGSTLKVKNAREAVRERFRHLAMDFLL